MTRWPLMIATTLFVAAASVDGGAALAADQLSAQDRQFMKQAAISGMSEVKMGELASEKAESEGVQEFASHMVEDHSQANEELMGLAAETGIEPPQELDAEHKQKMERLSQLSGQEFDRAYIQAQLEGHQKMVDLFQQQSEQGQNPELKSFAEETLPTLQEHLDMAQQRMAQLQ